MSELDVVLEWIDVGSAEAFAAVATYFDELERRFGYGFDRDALHASDRSDLRPPDGGFLVVRHLERVVGCGGVRAIEAGVAEIKRMWVDPEVRGQRLGVRILEALEGRAREMGHRVVRLDTDRSLVEAVAMYRREGYVEIDRYNDNPYPDAFFEKHL